MGQLSGLRDRHDTSVGGSDRWEELVEQVDRQNEDWVAAARLVSPGLLIDLLKLTGDQVSRYFATLDPYSTGPVVSWAGPNPAPMWLHIAREYTERWHHQQQIREAVGVPLLTERRMFHPVLATFVHALPRTYRNVPAEEGQTIRMKIMGDAGGVWSLVRGPNGWSLSTNDRGTEPTSQISISQEDVWRLFTKTSTIEAVRPRVHLAGNRDMGMKALETVSMIV